MKKIVSAVLVFITVLAAVACWLQPSSDMPFAVEVTVDAPVPAGTQLELPSFASEDSVELTCAPLTPDEVTFEVVDRLPEGITRSSLPVFSGGGSDKGGLPCELDADAVPEEGYAYLKVHMRVANPTSEQLLLWFATTYVARYDADAEASIVDADGMLFNEGAMMLGEGAYELLTGYNQPVWVSPGENHVVTSERGHPIDRELYPGEETSFDAYYLLSEEQLVDPDLCWMAELNGGEGKKMAALDELEGKTLRYRTYGWRVW